MRIQLDRQLQKPVYLQICDRFSSLIKTKILQPGERLPSIRSLAEILQVSKLTVVEAYNVLEKDGLIHARKRAGYFVSKLTIPSLKPELKKFAQAQDEIILEKEESSFFDLYITELRAQNQEDMINFCSGFPRFSNLENLQRIARRALLQLASPLLNYDLPQGQLTLRKQITRMLVQYGLEVFPEDLIITNGSQQGLSLAMHYYVQPGDWVIVETPTYPGAIEILKNLRARIVGVPMTKDGMNLELLEQYLHTYRSKLIYTISTLHNPTGLTTSQTHRQQLLSLAERYECPIVEDNAYEGLNFEPVSYPIKALDRHDLVTYIGTFSKTLVPSLRVGYMLVTGKHYQPILKQKLLSDLHVSITSQAIISEYLNSGHYHRHINRLLKNHLQSRNAMLQALERYFPQEASWTIPKGGIFLWVHLPDNLPIQEICREAASQKVLFASGSSFFPVQQGYSFMRLNFSNDLEDIDRGISVLGRLLKKSCVAKTF